MTIPKLLAYLKRFDADMVTCQNNFTGERVYDYGVAVGKRTAIHQIQDYIARRSKKRRKAK